MLTHNITSRVPVDSFGGRSTNPAMSDFMHVLTLGFSPGYRCVTKVSGVASATSEIDVESSGGSRISAMSCNNAAPPFARHQSKEDDPTINTVDIPVIAMTGISW